MSIMKDFYEQNYNKVEMYKNKVKMYKDKVKRYKDTLLEIRKVLTDEYYIDTVKAIHKIDEVLNG